MFSEFKELKEVTEDLIKSNVTCQDKAGQQNLSLAAKEQELQMLQQKLSTVFSNACQLTFCIVNLHKL